jgi:hypothetical protein
LARLVGDEAYARELSTLFETGSARYDELLWNGEYYIQLLNDDTPLEDQFGDGCLSDQLFGQWWAHLLDLGYILPEEHVHTTLRSIVRYNTREGFGDFKHGFRVYADRDDSGLLICTWPKGGRPPVPVRYCDEVWTGIEYQVAALCIMEGLVDEGMRILRDLRARYSGERRNPYNEIECGDHYSRAMAGWSVLEALSGARYDATGNQLTLVRSSGRDRSSLPLVAATGWGTISQRIEKNTLSIMIRVDYGNIPLERLVIDSHSVQSVNGMLDETTIQVATRWEDDRHTISFPHGTNLGIGTELKIRATS